MGVSRCGRERKGELRVGANWVCKLGGCANRVRFLAVNMYFNTLYFFLCKSPCFI